MTKEELLKKIEKEEVRYPELAKYEYINGWSDAFELIENIIKEDE